MRNTTAGTLVFRDDSGKRWVRPGEEFEVVGTQHEPHVRSLIEGGVPMPADDPAAAGEAGATPVREPRKRRPAR